jgi:hypothetical protein
MKQALTALALAAALSGCATIQRTPFTQREQAEAVIPGIPDARFWADAPDVGARMTPAFAGAQGETSMLALSGGSDNGAYGHRGQHRGADRAVRVSRARRGCVA